MKTFVLALLISNSVLGTVPTGFIEIDPYLAGSSEMSCANLSDDEWRVSLDNNKLTIGRALNSNSISLKVEGGTMVGHSRGEFGGGLEFKKGKESQKVFKKNISSLYPLPDGKVAAFGGLDHMFSDDGYLLVVRRRLGEGEWYVEKEIKLPGNPCASAVKDLNGFFFVTGSGLNSVDWKTGKIAELSSSSSQGLYPNSLVVAEHGHVYVGMRHAVAHFTPDGEKYKVKWLVKKRCTKAKL